jgi:hypothetical protein
MLPIILNPRFANFGTLVGTQRKTGSSLAARFSLN